MAILWLRSIPASRKILWSKFMIWICAFIPLARLIYFTATDQLGANPVEFVERSTGTWGLVFLLLSLAITPLKITTHQAWLMALRRLLGLWMFAYACLHLCSYLWLDYMFDMAEIMKDIVKHPFVLVGVCAFILTTPLAFTSNQIAMRVLKKNWKRLHRLVYLIALLVLLHFLWLVKKDITEPLIYCMVFTLLMIARKISLSDQPLKN